MDDRQGILEALKRESVQFVIVGGTAMVLHGSAYVTDDIDILYSRDKQNIRRLISALAPLDPRLRTSGGGIRFRFDERTIANGLNFTLTTSIGNIDILGVVAGVGDFESARNVSQQVLIGSQRYDVLTLKGLIRSKRAAGRRKDLIALPELEALEELHGEVELPHKE